MVGSLGQLIVEITTDMSNLNKGLLDAEKKVRDTSGKITEFTNKVGLTMTAMGAAITGAFALMIKSSVDYSDQIYEVSRRTGIAVESLSALKYVADQTESSFEAVAMGMRFLNRNIYEATTGNYKMNEAFRTLGITLKDDVTGNTMKAEDAFLKIADRFQNIQDNSIKTAMAIQIFGRSGESLIPILNLGSEGITRLSKEAERLGIVLSTDNAKAIDKFSDEMKTMKAALGGLWLNITQMLLPTLEGFINKITEVVVEVRKWSEEHPILAKGLTNTTLAIGTFLLILGPLILAFNQLVKAIMLLNIIIPGFAINIGTLTVAFKALGIAVPVLIALFAGWKLGEWLDNNSKKIENFWNKVNAFLHPAPKGAMVFDIGSSLGGKTPAPPVDLGKIGITKPAEELDQTVTLVERHSQKLKELNELYLIGKINAQQYYEAIKSLQQDGLDIKQQELELLNKSIEMEKLSTDGEYQRIYVMNEGIQTAQEFYRIKAELANQDLMDQQTSLTAATNLLETLQSMHKTIWQGIFDFINMGIKTFSSGMTTAITSIIMHTKTASQAFKDFGKMMIEAIVNFVVQWAIQAIIAATIGAALTTAVTAQAAILAAAWLPAAVLASVATFGGAAAAGAKGLAAAGASGIATMAMMKAAAIGISAMAEGGSGIVTRPTLFLAGEAGPESYSFNPINKGEGGVIINFTNYGDFNTQSDIEEMINELGNRVKNAVRGS